MEKEQFHILMVAINSSWSQSNLALFYLRETISDLPHKVQIRDWTLKDHLLDVLHDIFAQKPDVVCFSAYIWNRLYLQQLIPELKKLLPQSIIVLGGPEAQNLSPTIGKADFIIKGAGEAEFRALAKQNFIHEQTKQPNPLPLNQIPFPYRPEDKEALKGKLVYYECYRGCPYACVYCLSASDKRNELRFDPNKPEDVHKLYAELDALKELEPKTIKFVDRSFNVHPKLARLIWSYFIENDCPCDVHFEIYPDLLQEEDIRILESAPEGRIRFEIGIQTTNSVVSETCGRQANWDKAKAVLLELKSRTKVRIHADLIAGLPGEEFGSVLNSVNELCATLPDAVQLGTLKILPDTPMQELATQRGYKWLDTPPYQCLSSDTLDFEEMCLLESLAKILNLYWNKEEFANEWKEMLSSHAATEVLYALLDAHKRYGFELHSLAKGKRAAIMVEIYEIYGV